MLSLADQLLVAREPEMPGLATLLDTDAFVALLRTTARAVEIRSGQAIFTRYKPHTNCLVTYRLQLGTGEVLAYGIVHGRDAGTKLNKLAQKQAVASPLGVLIVAELALAIYGFPNDRKLKTLRRLADPTKRQQLFQCLLPQSPDLWAGNLIPLRYKPERRYVACLQADSGRAVLKFYTSQDYANAYASARAFRPDGNLCIAQPLGYSHRHQAQALAWLNGQPLDAVLADAPPEREMLAGVARTLAALHAQRPTGLVSYTRQAETEAMQTAANAIAALCPQWAGRAHGLAQRLTEQCSRAPVVDCAIHGDFSAGQLLLLEDGRVGLLDLDNAGIGDPMADLGTFAARCYQDALSGTLALKSAEAIVGELVDSYRRRATQRWDTARFRIHTAARLLRLAVEPFRQRQREWVTSMAATLQRAEELSDDAHP